MTKTYLCSPLPLVAVLLLCFGSIGVAQPLDSGDLVVAADVPFYPPLALSARIEGTVIATIRVSGGVVTEAEIVSGPMILASSVERNLLTWRFNTTVYGTQRVTYVFVLSETVVLLPMNPEIELRLPEFVKITAKPVRPLTLEHGGNP
jgi:hypothetical protein